MLFIIGGVTLFIAKGLDGKGTFLAQMYATLLIIMPLFIFSMLVIIVSLHLPALGLFLAGFDLLLLIYSVVLQVFSMMAVHSIGAVKATLIVLAQTIAIIGVVLVIVVVFMMLTSDSNSSDSGSGSGNTGDGGSKNTDTNIGDVAGGAAVMYPTYPVYQGYRRDYIIGDLLTTPVNTTTPGSANQPSPSPTPAPVPGVQAPAVALTEASCPTCYYTEWAEPLRVNHQLPCVHCGSQMLSTGNDRQGEPPNGYSEMQCQQCQYHEWMAQHRLDAGVMCLHCDVKMQPTGNKW